VLLELREELEELKALLRLAHDVKALPKLSSFQHAVTLVAGERMTRNITETKCFSLVGGAALVFT
jgi:hypothetical protein